MLLHKAQKRVIYATRTRCTAASKQLLTTPNTWYVEGTFSIARWFPYSFSLGSFNARFPNNNTIVDPQVSKWVGGGCWKLLHVLNHMWLAQGNNSQLLAFHTYTLASKINDRFQSFQKSHPQYQRHFIVKHLKHARILTGAQKHVQINLTTCLECATISQLHIVHVLAGKI